MRPPIHAAHRSLGFTLIEVIIAAGLLALLAATATFFWANSLSLARSQNQDSAAIAEARALLERVAREVREVKFNDASGAYCISTMAATQIVFNRTTGSYLSGCGGASPSNATNDFAINIQRPANTTNLNMSYAGALATPAVTRALSTQVTALNIRYLDSLMAATTSASALRYVEFTVTVQPGGVQATQARTLVALRNR